MRSVYLIRHGHPDFPIASRICLGQTDTPLGPLGQLQGVLLARAFAQTALTAVYTSPLCRAYDTARYLCDKPIVKNDLAEQATGLWDGLSFAEIAERWPEEYARRGEDPTRTMPGGEDLTHACARFAAAVAEILQDSAGDIAIIAHKGVIDVFLRALTGSAVLPKLPYGGYWHLTAEKDALGLTDPAPIQPHPELDRALCLALLQEVAPEPVIRHCEAVSALAREIAAALPLSLDTTLLAQAALLHDIARTHADHAQLGAIWLEKLGYPTVAESIRQHHDLETPALDEASIVYIADKCLRGAARVPLAERFAASRKKCQSQEALAAWEKRWQTTRILQETINTYCRKELIQ